MNFDKKKGLKIASFAGFGALAVAGLVAASQGGMMNLHGQSLIAQDTTISQIAPAGGEEVQEPVLDSMGAVEPLENDSFGADEESADNSDHAHSHDGEHDHAKETDGESPESAESIEATPEAYNDHGHSHDDDEEWVEDVKDTTCGVYDEWVNKPLDEEAVKAVGREYRILKPDSVMTMDHNPERMNVYINNNEIVLSVMCG